MAKLRKRIERIAKAKVKKVLEGFVAPKNDEEFAEEDKGLIDEADFEHEKLWSVMEMNPTKDAVELKKQYRKLCQQYHPDKFNGDPRKMATAEKVLAEINLTYDLLCDLIKEAA